jgi:OmpA family
VKLSADVLFAIDKSDLTAAANAVLQDVAKQIDASTGKAVKVDGYTDSTGNDAINQPLSQNRAKSVADALRGMVTRPGVTFQTAGHGAADPVADNGTVQGRQLNRRVTVTFALPVAKPSTTGPAGSGVPFEWSKGAFPAITTGQFTNDQAKGLKVEVNGLHRDASGLTTLVWTVHNTGTVHVDTGTALELNYHLQGAWAPHRGATDGGVMLADVAGKVRYHTLQAQIGHCLCTGLVGDAKTDLGPNESTTYSNVFKLSAGVATVDIQIPWYDKELLTIKAVPVK